MAQLTTVRVADNVRAELARAGKSGRQAALDLGYSSHSKFARRLSGSHPFTIDELMALAAYLHVPLVAFLPSEPTAAAS